MTSVERILQYTTLPQEAVPDTPTGEIAENWPQHGRIEMKDVSLSYSPKSPPALVNINLVLKPHEKVGHKDDV